MSQGSLNDSTQKLGSYVKKFALQPAYGHTHRQTHTKVDTENTLSGFQDFFLQPIMKDRSNRWYPVNPDLKRLFSVEMCTRKSLKAAISEQPMKCCFEHAILYCFYFGVPNKSSAMQKLEIARSIALQNYPNIRTSSRCKSGVIQYQGLYFPTRC